MQKIILTDIVLPTVYAESVEQMAITTADMQNLQLLATTAHK